MSEQDRGTGLEGRTNKQLVELMQTISELMQKHEELVTTLRELRALLTYEVALRVNVLKRENGMTELVINEKGLRTLCEAYRKAIDEGAETFEYRGHELVVGYAGYLIEFLQGQFAGRGMLPPMLAQYVRTTIEKKWGREV